MHTLKGCYSKLSQVLYRVLITTLNSTLNE